MAVNEILREKVRRLLEEIAKWDLERCTYMEDSEDGEGEESGETTGTR